MNTHISHLAGGALALLALAAAADEPKRLLGMRAGGDAQASTLEIEGDHPLSFTTMKLQDPPRVVVDFADTGIGDGARALEVGDGTLRRAAIAQAGSHTARVVVELAADAEFEVRAEGNRVEVRIPRSALAAQEPPPAPAGSPAEAEAEKVASLPTVSLVPSNPVEPPLPDPRTERQRAALEKAAAVKKALAERRAQAEQQRRDKAEQRRQAAADRAARKLAAAERRRTGIAKPAPAAPASAVAVKEPEEAPRAPIHESAAPPPAVAARQPEHETTPVLAAPAQARKAPERLAMAAGRHITGIGFRPVRGGEVIVRSDGPLEYGISGEGNSVLLHLPSTAIPLPNNRRPLDTQFFAGAVQRVVPLPVAGGTDVRIELREHAEYQLAQSGSVLTVTFSSPR
ncbi:MAG TPA: AMIN domain-containing protein [Myxococcales bacterium]|nr:AMIN domain-containing protein [Myxococcales bacterium]